MLDKLTPRQRIYLFGITVGILNFAGYYCLLTSYSMGQLALIQPIFTTSFIIPIILSVIFFKDRLDLRKVAIIGLTVLVLSLVIPTIYKSFTDVSVQPGFEFNATVTHLYGDQNGQDSTWFATIIRLNSEEQGEVYAEVDKALYPTLALDDEVQVGLVEGPSTIKLKVIERVSKNDRPDRKLFPAAGRGISGAPDAGNE